jgi:hypothetical protein
MRDKPKKQPLDWKVYYLKSYTNSNTYMMSSFWLIKQALKNGIKI